MRYVIGTRIPSNEGIISEGLYVFGKYGLPWILCEKSLRNDKIDNDRIMVFESIEEVNAYIEYLRKAYYKEFHDRAKRHNLDIRDFRIYPLKFDTYKMKHIKLGKQSWTKDKKHKVYEFKLIRD